MKAAALTICIAVATTGCATASKRANLELFNRTVPECQSGPECGAMWKAAHTWISQNSRLNIETATDELIHTYNSPAYAVELAMRATKIPIGRGRYRIQFEGRCGNFLGCHPTFLEAGLEFNAYVNNAGATQPLVAP